MGYELDRIITQTDKLVSPGETTFRAGVFLLFFTLDVMPPKRPCQLKNLCGCR